MAFLFCEKNTDVAIWSPNLINNIMNYFTVIHTEDALNVIIMMEIDETLVCLLLSVTLT